MKQYQVKNINSGATFTVNEGESVLNAALRQGVMLPYSCKNGMSQTVDQRWWRGFPGEELVFVSLEETLELAGHCMIGFAAVFCRVTGPAT